MPIDLVIQTAITTVVGILLKGLFDTLKRYIADSVEWRKRIDEKFDVQQAKLTTLMDATQATMRAQLIHNAEKYFERNWITPEERASWCDMHDRYSALGANGLIETYRRKIDVLPDKEI